MQKNQTFKTPTRNSPQKQLKQNLSQQQSQSQFKSQVNSTYMSKQLSLAHSSFPLKCYNQSHSSSPVQYICLKNDCDKPYRLACMQCMKGHHNDHVQYMVKISDFLNNENKETLPFEVPNWPRNDIGVEIKHYIQNEEQYIQSLYDGIDNVFNDFMQKVQLEVNKMKQNMQSDVANYYKKGPGKKKIDFINQLRYQYVESYNLTELQNSIKDLMNRGLQIDIFDTKVEYFLNSHQTQQARDNTNKFYLNNKMDAKFQMDFSLLQDLQKQITEQIYKCRKISNSTKKFEIPKTANTDFKPWSENFHSILNYLNQQYKNISDKDIVQYKQEIYADGSKYEGFLVNGQRDIIGSRFHVDGNNYFGEFSKGQKSGNGLIYYYKGNIYEGTFFNDKRDGYGKEMYTSGAKYEGEFSNDQKHGNGKYTYPDGRVFEGVYQNDKREGLGIIIYPNGKMEEVMYKNGERYYPQQQFNQVEDDSNQQTSQFPQNTSELNQQQSNLQAN